MNRFLAVAAVVALAGCTDAQLQSAGNAQEAGRANIDRLGVMCAATIQATAGTWAQPWALRACSTGAQIAELALDPSSLQWLADLSAKARQPL